MKKKKYILLTIDVEDWFQVENFKPWIPFDTWESYELRVERNVHRLLDLFDSMDEALSSEALADGDVGGKCPETEARGADVGNQMSEEKGKKVNSTRLRNPIYSKSSTDQIRATFFVLGWIAERLPGMVREIRDRGHEVASHGYGHGMCNMQGRMELEKDLSESKKKLEDILGEEVYGYRAPSFSVSSEVLKVIEQCGYSYDSSYNSFGMHGRYGAVGLFGYEREGIAYRLSNHFYELPISNIEFNIQNSKLVFPWGGGGYFRLIPSIVFDNGVKSILKRNGAYMFYMHPWEIDSDQPRMDQATKGYKFRHYVNLEKTYSKLKKLIKATTFCEFATCRDYLSAVIR